MSMKLPVITAIEPPPIKYGYLHTTVLWVKYVARPPTQKTIIPVIKHQYQDIINLNKLKSHLQVSGEMMVVVDLYI